MEVEKVISIQTKDIKELFEPFKESIKEEIAQILGEKYVTSEDKFQLALRSLLKKASLKDCVLVENLDDRNQREDLQCMAANMHYIQYAAEEKQRIVDMLASGALNTNDAFSMMLACVQKELDKRAKIYTNVVYGRKKMESAGVDAIDSLNYYLSCQGREETMPPLLRSLLRKIYTNFENCPERLFDVPASSKEEIISAIDGYSIEQLLGYCEYRLDTSEGAPEDELLMFTHMHAFVQGVLEHWDEIRGESPNTAEAKPKEILNLFQEAFDWTLPESTQKKHRDNLIEIIQKKVDYLQARIKAKMAIFGEIDTAAENLLFTLTKKNIEESKDKDSKSSLGLYKCFLSFAKSIFILIFMLNTIVLSENSEWKNLFTTKKLLKLISPILCLGSIAKLYANPMLLNRRKIDSSGYTKYPEDFVFLLVFFIIMSIVLCIMFPSSLQNYSLYVLELMLFIISVICNVRRLAASTKSLLFDDRLLSDRIFYFIYCLLSLIMVIGLHFYSTNFPVISNNEALNALVLF
ncbi:hypothetical protein NEAUS06_1379 [Nematocida ausubeli]|nr:hypothetical protein NEAUS06_1379 [Nematocida ausubeli]